MMQDRKIEGKPLDYRPLTEAELPHRERDKAYSISRVTTRAARMATLKLKKASRTMIESHPNSARWYCLRVETGKEQLVEGALLEANVQAFMPVEKYFSMHKGRKIACERPFFPGYLLVRIVPSDEAFAALRRASKFVFGFVGGALGYHIIRDEHVIVLNHIMQSCDVPRMKTDKSIRQGDQANIEIGPFAGFVCVVTAVKWSREARASVRIHIEGRAFDIDSMPLAFLKKL